MGEAEPCPSENLVPATSPGPVRNEEIVVRFVELKAHIGRDETGDFRLVPAAVSTQDLKGRGGHSFSLFREAHLAEPDLKARASARSYAEWRGNPVLARTRAQNLREITDGNGWREICLNSDPTTNDDPLGACPAHASAVRSGNPPRNKQRVELQMLRSQVSECFADVRHFNGQVPEQ